MTNPEIGESYEFVAPFGEITVTRFVRRWVYFDRPDGDIVNKRGKRVNRVKRRNFASRIVKAVDIDGKPFIADEGSS